MKIRLKKLLKILVPISIGIFFIWYSLHKTTPEGREKLWQSISNAEPLWIVVSALLGVLAHLSRAHRWQYLAKAMGYQTRLAVSYMALMIGYLANLGIPRSGEILRATTLSNFEEVPFQKTVGTIISERIIDLIMLLLVVFLGFVTNTQLFISYFQAKNIKPLFIVLGVLLFVVSLYGSYWLIQKSNFKVLKKIKKFVLEIYDGILSVFKMKNKGAFIMHTVFIWGAYILMFYIMKFAIPEINNLSFSASLAAFIVGSFAMTASNGGFGIFPVAIGTILVFFDVEDTVGIAYGWLLWGTQTMANAITGGFSFIFLPFFTKRK